VRKLGPSVGVKLIQIKDNTSGIFELALWGEDKTAHSGGNQAFWRGFQTFSAVLLTVPAAGPMMDGPSSFRSACFSHQSYSRGLVSLDEQTL